MKKEVSMRTFIECIPCFVKQALDATKLATQDLDIQQKAVKLVLERLSKTSWNTSPPYLGRLVHNLIKEITGNSDPYKSLKIHSNKVALKLADKWEKRILSSEDPFELAVKLSLAGNTIDFGARPGEKIDIEKEIETVMNMQINRKNLEFFRDCIKKSKKILFLTDNAGEIVFDKFLIKEIGPSKVVCAVKSKPIINDATLGDAKMINLTKIVKVIENGSDYPGTVIDECSEEFRSLFWSSDIIIAKGQGNYETLNEVKAPIFFLFKVKCPVVAGFTKRKVGDIVLYPSLS